MKAHLLVAALLLSGASPALADPYQAATGLTNPGTTIDFDDLSDGDAITNQYSSQGVTFTGLYATSGFSGQYPNLSNISAADFSDPSGQVGPSFTLDFAAPVSDAVFALVTDADATTTITAYLDGTVVESDEFATGLDGGFFGINNTSFDSLLVTIDAEWDYAIIDQLAFDFVSTQPSQTSDVPEPASVALLAAALCGLSTLRRRRA